jgi:hypothetical protein
LQGRRRFSLLRKSNPRILKVENSQGNFSHFWENATRQQK